MRAWIAIASLSLAWAAGTSLAREAAPPPTRVCEVGLYECPIHADVLATWPAQCPRCQAVLGSAAPSAVAPVHPGAWDPQRDQEQRERLRRNEQWRPWGQRNEQLRRQAQRNRELREQARRREGFRQPPPDWGGRPPEGYAYPYPYNYQYNPDTGRYEYLSPGPDYPYGGYQYNPNPGLDYYNPNADQYYYNPNKGHYFYNPYTGQYVYVNPRSISTDDDFVPEITLENRRREEEDKAREARRQEQERQAQRNAQRWVPYGNYGSSAPGGSPNPVPPPGHAYQRPYNYRYNPNTGRYEYVNPGYAYPYGAYSYNPSTGQYSYLPGVGQYSYNPNTGQYQYITPEYGNPNRQSEERRAQTPRRP